jgi:hypothetical protein
MGKGRIISNQGDGQYTIAIVHDRIAIEAELEKLAADIAAITELLGNLTDKLDETEAAHEAALAALNTAIATRDADGNIDRAAVTEKTKAAAAAEIDYRIAQIDVAECEGRLLTAQTRQTELQALPDEPQQSAWCADYSTDLTGEVATAEIPGEPAAVQIRPAHDDSAAWSATRDGQLAQRAGMSPEQAYFNAAVLPGVQRWKPTYRVGVITALTGGAADVTLDAATSSAAGLAVDPPGGRALTGVPIDYMDCDDAVFLIGDRVLVEFSGQDYTQPQVIGFESEPRSCAIRQYVLAGANVYWYSPNNDPAGVDGFATMVAPNSYCLAVVGSRAFLASFSDGKIYENNLQTGVNALYATPAAISVANDIASDGDHLYVSGTDGAGTSWLVAKYDLATGVKLWELPVHAYTEGGEISIAANPTGFMCADNGDCYTFDGDGVKTSGNLHASLGMVDRLPYERAVCATRDRFYVMDKSSFTVGGTVRIFQFANGGGSNQVIGITSPDVTDDGSKISASETQVCIWTDWLDFAVPMVSPKCIVLPRTVVRDVDGFITSDTIATTGMAYLVGEESYIEKACVDARSFLNF